MARNTIKRILIEAGVDPAPERGKRMSWRTFLRAHWGAIAATDFFTVEVLTLAGLVRYHVLFVIGLASRRVHIAGIVREPYDAWMGQVARNLTDADAIDGFLISHRYLIMDRAPVFTAGFRALLAGSGVNSVQLPRRSPNLNAYAERFVRSIRQECLSKVVPLGERHLRELVREYVAQLLPSGSRLRVRSAFGTLRGPRAWRSDRAYLRIGAVRRHVATCSIWQVLQRNSA
jgi:transposase InsO family protein